jgi:hypothetical protein
MEELEVFDGKRVCIGVINTDICVAVCGDAEDPEDKRAALANAYLMAESKEMRRLLMAVLDEPMVAQPLKDSIAETIARTQTSY